MLPLTAKNLAIFLFSTLLLPVFAAADDYPIELEVVSPVPPNLKGKKADPESHNIQFRSGWSLTFKLSTNDEFLDGTLVPGTGLAPASEYPEAGTPAWLIFDDADDCLYLEGHAFNSLSVPCEDQTGAGEVFLNFTPDIDFPYLEDLDPGKNEDYGDLRSHGRPDLRADLAKRYPDNGPEWGGPALSASMEVREVGTVVQGILDGVGYGSNDDLPGLVLVSNVGVGIVYDPFEFENDCDSMLDPDCVVREVCEEFGENCFGGVKPPLGILESWERAVPEARHNLSGLMGMVAYELNDQKRNTTLTTSLLVPRHLFSHLQALDPCYDGTDGEIDDGNYPCEGGGEANRIDAGPLHYPSVDPSVSIVEIRAFVVNGTAPASIEDCNDDFVVTAVDAECAGYTLISNEVVLEFTQIGGLVNSCSNIVDPWKSNTELPGYGYNVKLVDLDGNLSHHSADCPGGGGGVTRPPR
jgi:hypothetical protein